MRFILASGSPGRLATLRGAGIEPAVLLPDVDEEAVTAASPADLVAARARLKGEAALGRLAASTDVTILVACDSMLLIGGTLQGKPASPQVARERWHAMRGRPGELLTGHHVTVVRNGLPQVKERVARTVVHFAELSDEEVDAYVASGEPLAVAGAFTIDGLGGAFVDRIEGDPHNVVGLSLPLLRRMLAALDVPWPALWARADRSP